MKTVKMIDIAGQLVIMLAAYLKCDHSFDLWTSDAAAFSLFYFGLGGWQALSCLTQAIAIPAKERNGSRQAYERVLIVILIIGIIILPFMLIIGPLMALWYFITSVAELFESKATDLETI